MHVWLSEAGEPLPLNRGERLLRYGELSRYLAAAGHRVTWWGCDFAHRKKSYIGRAGDVVEVDGVAIHLVHGSGYRRNVSIQRLIHLEVHARNLRRAIADQPPPDVIVSALPATESSEVMIEYGRAHGVPVVVDVRDEWPEDYVRWLPSAFRPLGRFALRSKFRQLERVCRSASAVFGVTKRQLDYGLSHGRRTQSALDSVVYTGARANQSEPERVRELIAQWRSQGIQEGRFICLFAGTMSPSRPLGPVIDAVLKLSKEIPITLVIAGNGDSEGEYRRRAAGNPAIHFAGWVGQDSLAALMEIADILIAPYHPEYGFSMPTKLYDYMAAGRPIVSSCPDEAHALIERTSLGINYPYDSATAVEAALRALYVDPERRKAMGAKAREVFDREFCLDSIVRIFECRLEAVVGRVKKAT